MNHPDLTETLRSGLKVVFCGTDVCDRTTSEHTYYNSPKDKFWTVLADSGLTPERLGPSQSDRLLDFDIGLAEVAKGRHGVKRSPGDEQFDGSRLRQRILRYKPRILAFNGKKAAAIYLERKPIDLEFGLYGKKVGTTEMWVLPSTSLASGWDEDYWRALAAALKDADVAEPQPAGVGLQQ